LSQLEDNVQAANLQLSAAELAKLDALTKPTFGLPQSMQPMFPSIINGGTSLIGTFTALTVCDGKGGTSY
jgi:hypothetical protein